VLAAGRGRRTIENKIHLARDVTYAEAASWVQTGPACQAMATLRVLARSGPTQLTAHANVAAAVRHCADRIDLVVDILDQQAGLSSHGLIKNELALPGNGRL
jgi:hypothetical protein